MQACSNRKHHLMQPCPHRKAYRLGKWLANVNTLRKTPVKTQHGFLELLSNGGEAVYYFMEQGTWLVKAGLLDKRHAKSLSQISAWAEVVGYCGSSTLNCLRIMAALERERGLREELLRRKKVIIFLHVTSCNSFLVFRTATKYNNSISTLFHATFKPP